jgi:hypothetical protein
MEPYSTITYTKLTQKSNAFLSMIPPGFYKNLLLISRERQKEGETKRQGKTKGGRQREGDRESRGSEGR